MEITGVSAYSNTGVYNNKAKSTETELTDAIKNFEELHKLSAKELKDEKTGGYDLFLSADQR